MNFTIEIEQEGGYRQGSIERELGRYGIENYLQTKQVYVNLNQKPVRW